MSVGARAIILAALAALCAAASAETPPSGELAIVPPAAASLPLSVAAGEILFCRGRQLGVDVALRLLEEGGEKLLEVDSPLDRRGEELLFYRPAPAPAAKVARLELAPVEKGAPAGKVALTCEILAEGDRRLAAFEAASRAGATWAAGRVAQRKAAAEEYGRARQLLEEAGEPWLAAQALYSRAVLLRLAEDIEAGASEAAASLAAWQKLGDRAFEAAAANELGLLAWRQGDLKAARNHLENAIAIAAELGDAFTRAAALANVCLLDLVEGAVRQGLACNEKALPAIALAEAPAIELSAWVNVGRANDVLGEPAKALEAYSRAEQLYAKTGDELGLARTLNNRGVLARQLGRYENALELYSRSFSLFEKLGERRWRARTLGNLGVLFAELGDGERARQHLERALAAWRELGDRAGESVALTQLGRHFGLAGEPAKAAEHYRLALAIDRQGGSRRAQALSLAGLAGALAESSPAEGGSPAEGLPLFGEAIGLLRAEGDRANLAYILCKQGQAALQAGELVAAGAALEEAATLSRANGLRAAEVCAEKERAALLARQGDAAGALARLEQALEVADGLRRELVSPDLRASYSRIERQAYEQYVAAFMARDRAEPGAGFAGKALEASERARARTFVELLAEARADLRGGAPPEKAAGLAAAVSRLAAKNERAQAANGEEKSRLESEMLEIEREIDRLQTEIRRENPRWASLERPPVPSAAAMRGLLDVDTVMLVYFLAEERSYLFRVDPGTVEAFELAPRREIEAAARRFYQELSSPGREPPAAGAEVARLVLGPLAGRLDGRRLVVVPDGALAYLPFGALPLIGGTGGELLLDGRGVIHLPSIAALEQLRAGDARQKPRLAAAEQPIAIFADPVYDPADPRVRGESPADGRAGGEEALTRGGDTTAHWARLAGSRREAETIAALLPQAQVSTDFAARRENVLGDRLAAFRIVHFATHGSIDAARPALSGLVLSTVDADGKPIEGMLRLDDIYGMRLGADLVVLSGCRTALGEEIRGEGLVGISRGFFYAGAKRVLASLWPVEDFATAALMQSFYQALASGQQPEKALRQAQASLREQRRTRDPRAWAGFVLLGDWR
jgi:CHAT domain-containing protein/tetratricopeptide (TPR) repeat protein